MTKLGVRQDFRSLLATGLMIALGLLTFTCTKKRSPLQVDDGNDTTEDTYDQYGQDPAARLSTLAERLIKDMVMAVGPSGEHADQNSLSESDAMVVSKAATDAVIAAGVSTSTDATKLVGVIIYGAASALPVAPISINDHGRVSALTGLMASGLFASLKDLDAANLPQGSATVGMTAKATAHTAIANGAVRSLANSVIPVSDMAHVIDDVSQSIVAQVGETGSNEATILQYDLPAIAAGITTGVAALPAGAGDKRSLIRSASEGAVRGLGSIAALLPSNGSIGRAITVLVSSMTENLDVFSIESDSIRFFAAEVTSGAEAAVDSVVTAYAGSSVSRSDLVLATTNGSFEGLNIVASKVAAVASRAVSPSIASTLPSTPAPAASSVQSPGGSNAGATLNLSGISIDANGNFGIGTETPAARLHVSGSAGTDGIMFPDGTVQRTAAIGAGSSQWTTAGSNIYFNAGNVGIGTTAPASTLEVTGNIMMSQGANRTISVATTTSNTAGNSLTIRSGTAQQSGVNGQNGGSLYLTGGTGYGVTAANSGGNVYAYGGPGTGSAASNGNVILAHNGTSSVGNVGIGTTAPTKTLDVSSANFINLGLYRSATGAAYGSGIDFDLNNASNARKTFAEIYGAITTNTAGAEDGYLALSTATAGALTEKVRVTKDGNVGIGITSPAYRLDVAGNSRFISASESIYSSDNSLSEYLYIQPVSGSPGYVRLGAYSAVYGSQSLALQPSAGNVGIGSTAPKQKLDVNGSAQITGDLGVGTAAPTQKLDVNGNINVASDARIYMGTTSLAAPGLNSTGQRIQLYGSSGTVTGSDYSLGIENGHMWFNSGGGFKWYSQTGFDMVLDNTGKLGIGTSAPATALEVNGVVKSKAGGFQFPDGTIITTAPGTGTVTNQVSSADINFAADTANSGNPNYNISFSTRGAQRMVVANSGGIGIGTASPASTLDVRGGVAVGDYAGVNSAPFNTLIVSGGLGVGTSAPTSFVHTNDNLSKTTNHTGILFNVANTSSTPSVRKVGLDLQSTGVWNGVSSVNTGLNVNASGGSVNYAAVFSGGNVGIGTSMPGSTLQVNGSVAVGYSAATTASSSGLAVAGNIGIGTTSPRATIESVGPIATSGPVGGFILYNRGSSAISSQWYSPSLGETRLYDHPSSSDRLTISSSGNFGIGTTAPAARLDVSGSRSGTPSLVGAFIGSAPTTFTDTTTVASGTAANHAFNAIAAPTLASTYAAVTTTNSYSLYLAGAPKKGTNDTITNAVALGIGSTFLGGGTNSYGLVVDAQTGATNNFAAVFKSGNVGIGTTAPGYLLQVAGSVAGVGSYVALSDRREKKDVRDLSDSLEKALAIRGVSYKWRDEIRYGSERHLGVIAQELEKIVPEAVNTGDDGLKRVKYDDLIPLMIEAFKEERRQKDAEINRLRARSQQMTDFLCKKFDDASFCRMPEL